LEFTKGFKEVRDKVQKGSKYIRSCYNCAHFYQAVGDDHEVCQNNSVLEYDMVVTENNIYCGLWKPLDPIRTKALFKGKKGMKLNAKKRHN
jgi:hypothetical protein